MTAPFGWQPKRTEGIWRYGAPSLRPFVASAPWLTVGLLLLMFHLIGGTLVAEKGVLFDLPEPGLAEGEATGPVALIVPVARETLVFFDDARYTLGDAASAAALAEHFSDAFAESRCKTLLSLADRRVSSGDLMRFAALARMSGVGKVLFAEKKTEREE